MHALEIFQYQFPAIVYYVFFSFSFLPLSLSLSLSLSLYLVYIDGILNLIYSSFYIVFMVLFYIAMNVFGL